MANLHLQFVGCEALDGSPRSLETRYAYYRRCQAFKHDGEQCKNPALKGGEICYQHQASTELKQRRNMQLGALNLPPLTSFDNLQRAISILATAIVESRIDVKSAGRLANAFWLAGKLLRLQARMAKPGRVESMAAVEKAVEAEAAANT